MQNTKLILGMGIVLTVLGILLFPFGYDAIFYFVLSQAGDNYALATAWMYTVAIGVGSIGFLLTHYARKRKHFTNKWFIFGMIIVIMVLVLFGLQAWRMVMEGAPV